MGADRQRRGTLPTAVPQHPRRAKSPRHSAVPASTASCSRWGGAASPGKAARGAAPMQTAWFREQGDLRAEERKLGQAGKLPATSWVPQTHPGWRWVRGGLGEARQRCVGAMPPEGTMPPPTPTPALGCYQRGCAAGKKLFPPDGHFSASALLACVCRGAEMWFQSCL